MRTAAEIAGDLASAEAALTAIAVSPTDDPAICRVNGALLKRLGQQTDRALARYTEAAGRVEALRHSLLSARAREAKQARIRLTVDDVTGARFVQDRFGWHKVVRVSAKSVTVETGYSWTDRIAIENVLAVAS